MTSKEFDKYFRILYLPLGMYALRIVEDSDVAEDLVQNAFTNAWQSVCDRKDIDNFKAFMYRSVRNECISYLRRKRETVGIDAVPEYTDEVADTSVREALSDGHKPFFLPFL